jgi:hypothetical protein
MDKAITRMVRNGRKVFKVSRVGQFIEIHHCIVMLLIVKKQPDERTPDEPSASGNQELHLFVL